MKLKYISIKNEEFDNKLSQKKISKFNYGLALLKFIQEFFVVTVHTFKKDSTENKIIRFITKDRKHHVPSFFIISFYFMCKNLLSLNLKVILKRLVRLFIPYVGWSIIILKTNRLYNLINKNKKYLPDNLREFKLQLLWGHGYIPQFWFLWNLIVITLLLFIIIFIFKKHSLFIIQTILILFYMIQYSEYHYKNIYLKYPYYNRRTLGLFFESVPFAVTGFTLGFYKIFDILQKIKFKVFFLSILIYNLFANYNIINKKKGVIYQGLKLNIESVIIIFVFSLFPSDKIKNKFISKFITLITNYTAGIYYLHFSIRYYFMDYINCIKRGTFFGTIIIYLICYFICFISLIIFGKTSIKYLFC